jgi:integrase
VFGPLKTAGSRRTVLLTEVAVAALHVHRDQQSINVATVTDWCDSGLVFTNGLGGPLEPSVPGSALKRVMRQAALPRIRVHDLRHTTATVLLVAGVHPKVVQDLLGHRTIVVTMDTYSHVMPVLHLQAIQTLNSLLASPSAR